MTSAHYQLDWPRENLIVRCFVHDVMNYRYHWHEDDYELSILLHGTQEYCRGNKNFLLRENDIILTAPGIGHASMGQQADTIAFVLHFSASAFKPFLKKGGIYDFPSCLSDETTRESADYRQVRFYASQIFRFAQEGGAYAQLAVRANLDLLIITLCTRFSPTLLNKSIKTAFLLFYDFSCLSNGKCFHDLLIGCILLAPLHILADRSCKQDCLLWNNRNLASK